MHAPAVFKLIEQAVGTPGIASFLPLFFLALVNEVIGIFPLTIALAAALLFAKKAFTLTLFNKLFLFVAIPVSLGSVLGSLPLYTIAYFGGKSAIDKFHKHLRFSWRDVEEVNLKFKGLWYDEFIFLFLRALPMLPSLPVDIAAGILRMELPKYFALTLIGYLLRIMLTFLLLGWGIHGLSHFTIFLYTKEI